MGQLVSDIDKPDIVRIARIAWWEGEVGGWAKTAVEENVGW